MLLVVRGLLWLLLLLGHFHARHLTHLVLFRNRRWRWLILLFAGLREDLTSLFCKIVGRKGVTKGVYGGFRR
jgi:hypothetical protein